MRGERVGCIVGCTWNAHTLAKIAGCCVLKKTRGASLLPFTAVNREFCSSKAPGTPCRFYSSTFVLGVPLRGACCTSCCVRAISMHSPLRVLSGGTLCCVCVVSMTHSYVVCAIF